MSSEDKAKYLEMMMPRNHIYQWIFGIVFFIIWSLDSFLLRITTFLADQLYFWIPLIPAVVILFLSAYLIDASHKDLFDSGAFGLKTQGIFSKVRHPMYLGIVLFYLALAVFTISLVSILMFFLILIGYNYIANYEEERLIERFGEEYIDYKKRVGKWFPSL